MMLKNLLWLTVFAAAAMAHGAEAKPSPKPNYIYAEKGIYYYEAAISPQQREAGAAAGEAVGYRYYGTNSDGEYILARVESNGAIYEYVYCKKPCRVIRTSGGSRIANNNVLVASAAFSDAFRGKLRNTNPDVPKPRPTTPVNVPSRSPVGANVIAPGVIRTTSGVAIRSTANAPVYATANGIVEFSGELAGYGSAIKIDHGNEIQTIYGNLGRMNVSPKAAVTKGQVIGFVVAPMNGSDPELLYEVRIAGVAIDPLAFLGKGHAN